MKVKELEKNHKLITQDIKNKTASKTYYQIAFRIHPQPQLLEPLCPRDSNTVQESIAHNSST